jgi:hypothetical protein
MFIIFWLEMVSQALKLAIIRKSNFLQEFTSCPHHHYNIIRLVATEKNPIKLSILSGTAITSANMQAI